MFIKTSSILLSKYMYLTFDFYTLTVPFTRSWCTTIFSSPITFDFLRIDIPKQNGTSINEPRHDKTNKMSVCPAKTRIRTQSFFMQTTKTDQTGRMPRLIWVFAGRTLILLVLSCRDSYCQLNSKYHTSLVTRKPVFGVSNQVRLKPVCSTT